MLGSPIQTPIRPRNLSINRASPHAVALQMACPFFASGSNIYDASGFGRHGATVNNPLWKTDAMGAYLEFVSGSSQAVTFPLIDGTKVGMYMSAWFYLTTAAARAQLWTVGDSGSSGFSVEIKSSSVFTLTANGIGGWSGGDIAITTGTWHNLVWTITAGNVWTAYLNGVQAATASGLSTVTPTDRIELGRFFFSPSHAFFLNGRIADFRIGYYCPTAAEVWSMYDPATRWDLYRANPVTLTPCQPGPFPHHLRRRLTGGFLEAA